ERSDRGSRHSDEGRALATRGARDPDPVKRLSLAILLFATPAYAETWELKVPERVELTVGTSGTLPISLAVDRGKTISKDAGIVLDLAPEGGLTVKKRRLARTDAVDPDA